MHERRARQQQDACGGHIVNTNTWLTVNISGGVLSVFHMFRDDFLEIEMKGLRKRVLLKKTCDSVYLRLFPFFFFQVQESKPPSHHFGFYLFIFGFGFFWCFFPD